MRDGPPRREAQGHGVPILLVGVTSHQGDRESRSQGEGAQVSAGDSWGGRRDAESHNRGATARESGWSDTGKRSARKPACCVCAVRRVVVFLAQPGGTWRKVLGSPSLPKGESPRGPEHAGNAAVVRRRCRTRGRKTRVPWPMLDCIKSNSPGGENALPSVERLYADAAACFGQNGGPRQPPDRGFSYNPSKSALTAHQG